MRLQIFDNGSKPFATFGWGRGETAKCQLSRQSAGEERDNTGAQRQTMIRRRAGH